AEVLRELGAAEAAVSGEAAIEHLRAAYALMEDPIDRAQTALLLGRQLFLLREDESDAVFTKALDELDGADPELAPHLQAGLTATDLSAPSRPPSGSQRLEPVRPTPADETVGEKLLLSLLAYHDARANAPAAEVVPFARRALADGALVRGDIAGPAFVPAC